MAVAPFRDLRQEPVPNTERAPLRLALLGAVRSGEDATGDESFLGDVAEYSRQDAAATLLHAGLFAQVLLRDESAISAGGAEPAVDWTLYGEVEEFIGIQSRTSELNLLRIPPLRNRVETPLGIARVFYRVVDSGGTVRFEKRIETQLSGRGLDLAQVALDAMAATSEQLAAELYRMLAPAPPVRAVPFLVLDACGLGEKRVQRLLEDVNEVLERELQLRLEAELQPWQSPDAVKPAEVLAAVKKRSPPAHGVLLALVPSTERTRSVLRRELFGLATQLGEHAVVACGPDASLRTVTVIHEIGHLLGAVHVNDRSSIMHPVAEFEARFFDDWNRRILRVGRRREFGRPPSPELRSELRALYQSPEREQQRVPEGDLEAALRTVREGGVAAP
jgi:hypothetical protein